MLKVKFSLTNSFSMWGFPGGSVVKNPPASAGDVGLISVGGNVAWRRKWQPMPYSYLGIPMELGWPQAMGSQKSWTPLRD